MLLIVRAYKACNAANTDAIKKALNDMLSTKAQAQAQADDLGFVPLKGDILSKARAAVNKIGQ